MLCVCEVGKGCRVYMQVQVGKGYRVCRLVRDLVCLCS